MDNLVDMIDKRLSNLQSIDDKVLDNIIREIPANAIPEIESTSILGDEELTKMVVDYIKNDYQLSSIGPLVEYFKNEILKITQGVNMDQSNENQKITYNDDGSLKQNNDGSELGGIEDAKKQESELVAKARKIHNRKIAAKLKSGEVESVIIDNEGDKVELNVEDLTTQEVNDLAESIENADSGVIVTTKETSDESGEDENMENKSKSKSRRSFSHYSNKSKLMSKWNLVKSKTKSEVESITIDGEEISPADLTDEEFEELKQDIEIEMANNPDTELEVEETEEVNEELKSKINKLKSKIKTRKKFKSEDEDSDEDDEDEDDTTLKGDDSAVDPNNTPLVEILKSHVDRVVKVDDSGNKIEKELTDLSQEEVEEVQDILNSSDLEVTTVSDDDSNASLMEIKSKSKPFKRVRVFKSGIESIVVDTDSGEHIVLDSQNIMDGSAQKVIDDIKEEELMIENDKEDKEVVEVIKATQEECADCINNENPEYPVEPKIQVSEDPATGDTVVTVGKSSKSTGLFLGNEKVFRISRKISSVVKSLDTHFNRGFVSAIKQNKSLGNRSYFEYRFKSLREVLNGAMFKSDLNPVVGIDSDFNRVKNFIQTIFSSYAAEIIEPYCTMTFERVPVANGEGSQLSIVLSSKASMNSSKVNEICNKILDVNNLNDLWDNMKKMIPYWVGSLVNILNTTEQADKVYVYFNPQALNGTVILVPPTSAEEAKEMVESTEVVGKSVKAKSTSSKKAEILREHRKAFFIR